MELVDIFTVREHMCEIEHISRKYNMTPYRLIEIINNMEKVKVYSSQQDKIVEIEQIPNHMI